MQCNKFCTLSAPQFNDSFIPWQPLWHCLCSRTHSSCRGTVAVQSLLAEFTFGDYSWRNRRYWKKLLAHVERWIRKVCVHILWTLGRLYASKTFLCGFYDGIISNITLSWNFRSKNNPATLFLTVIFESPSWRSSTSKVTDSNCGTCTICASASRRSERVWYYFNTESRQARVLRVVASSRCSFLDTASSAANSFTNLSIRRLQAVFRR